jgi:bacillithiol biosynthesis deacetylase BshB1
LSEPSPILPESTEACELVVVVAHPDDAELCAGGLLISAARRGWRTAVVDLTRGELGSLGTVATRAEEASAAARVLGLSRRINLGLPDGAVRDTDENRLKVVLVVRELRPRILVTHPREDHHPDHMGAAELVRQSFYLCGIRKFAPEMPPWRPRGLLYTLGSRARRPDLIFNISDVIKERMKAVRCYRSQFEAAPGEDSDFAVRIASDGFLEGHRASLKHWGSLIGAAYGEPYSSEAPLSITDPAALFASEPWKKP